MIRDAMNEQQSMFKKPRPTNQLKPISINAYVGRVCGQGVDGEQPGAGRGKPGTQLVKDGLRVDTHVPRIVQEQENPRYIRVVLPRAETRCRVVG